MHEHFDPTPLPIRAGLAVERERAWERLAAPGTWWNSATRLAIAAEVRNASICLLCRERKAALSPYTIDGTHHGLGALSEPIIEITHRVATDAGRITQAWIDSLHVAGVTDEQYIETVGVVSLVTALDTFDHALGLTRRPLPPIQPGEPTRHRPAWAKRDLAWVPTVAPEVLTADDPDPYSVHGAKNIHRAMSLVPQEVINFFDLDVELYLKDHEIRDFATEHRALTHAQIELIAGRVSALNGCYY